MNNIMRSFIKVVYAEESASRHAVMFALDAQAATCFVGSVAKLQRSARPVDKMEPLVELPKPGRPINDKLNPTANNTTKNDTECEGEGRPPDP